MKKSFILITGMLFTGTLINYAKELPVGNVSKNLKNEILKDNNTKLFKSGSEVDKSLLPDSSYRYFYTYNLLFNSENTTEMQNEESTVIDSNLFSKTIYSYDDNGNLIFYATHEFNNNEQDFVLYEYGNKKYENNKLIVDETYSYDEWFEKWYGNKYEYDYDENGNTIKENYYCFNYDTENWIIEFSSENEYNSSNEILSSISFNYYDGSLISGMKYEYLYQSSGKIAENKYYSWNEPSQSWHIRSVCKYLYNNKSNIVSSIFTSWDENQDIIISIKDSSLYNDEGWLLLHISYSYDNSTQNWNKDVIDSTIYNNNPDNSITIQKIYDITIDEWVNENMIESNYDAVTLTSTIISSSWQESDNKWIKRQKIITQKDNFGNEISKINYNYNTVNEDWELYSKLTSIYNENNVNISYSNIYDINGTYIGSKDSTEFNSKNQKVSFSVYNYNGITFSLINKTYYYFPGYTQGINESPNQATFMCYPNPTTGVFKLLSSEPVNGPIEIFDNAGKLVYKNIINADFPDINLSGYPSGIYHVRGRIRNKNINRKLIIRK
ncbi:MAG: T9SS type A sorting domain-containing protein [Bacteroidales bacterium]|nr:T9SS type A sorting domain-containing protein [Bacteroidales bacterium]